jgi:phage terminase large subunit-like protein
VIEVGHLLAEVKVLEERGTAIARLQRVLVVVDPNALVGGEHLTGTVFAIHRQVS